MTNQKKMEGTGEEGEKDGRAGEKDGQIEGVE